MTNARLCRMPLVCIGLGLLLATAGCGPRLATVTGTVTFDGKPLPSAIVTFVGENGLIDSGATNAEGQYELHRVPVGKVKVSVATVPPPKGDSAASPPPVKVDLKNPAKSPASPPRKYVPIPEKYKSAEKSGLTYDVGSGKQTIDIALTPEKK